MFHTPIFEEHFYGTGDLNSKCVINNLIKNIISRLMKIRLHTEEYNKSPTHALRTVLMQILTKNENYLKVCLINALFMLILAFQNYGLPICL